MTSVVEASARPLVATMLGIALYVWLFRTEPKTLYFTYLILNEQGIEYVHTPDAARGRVSRYA